MDRNVKMQVVLVLLVLYSNELMAQSCKPGMMELVQNLTGRKEIFFTKLSSNNRIIPTQYISEQIGDIHNLGKILSNLISTETNQTCLEPFNNLSTISKTIIEFVKPLRDDFNRTGIENHLESAITVIDSCSEEKYKLFCEPTNKALLDRTVQCSSDTRLMEVVRNLFKHSKTSYQSCNGMKIGNFYKTVLNLVYEGCEIAVLGQRIKYNGTYDTIIEECNGYFLGIENHLRKIFNDCSEETCNNFFPKLIDVVQKNFDSEMYDWTSILSFTFPYFTFSVYTFSKKTNYTLIGNEIPSSATFCNGTSSGTYSLFLWTPYQSVTHWNSPPYGYTLSFDKESYANKSVDMNVTENFETNPVMIICQILMENNIFNKNGRCQKSDIDIGITSGSSKGNPFIKFIFVLTVLNII